MSLQSCYLWNSCFKDRDQISCHSVSLSSKWLWCIKKEIKWEWHGAGLLLNRIKLTIMSTLFGINWQKSEFCCHLHKNKLIYIIKETFALTNYIQSLARNATRNLRIPSTNSNIVAAGQQFNCKMTGDEQPRLFLWNTTTESNPLLHCRISAECLRLIAMWRQFVLVISLVAIICKPWTVCLRMTAVARYYDCLETCCLPPGDHCNCLAIISCCILHL